MLLPLLPLVRLRLVLSCPACEALKARYILVFLLFINHVCCQKSVFIN